jgi:hypothetical protein
LLSLLRPAQIWALFGRWLKSAGDMLDLVLCLSAETQESLRMLSAVAANWVG